MRTTLSSAQGANCGKNISSENVDKPLNDEKAKIYSGVEELASEEEYSPKRKQPAKL